MTTPTITDWDNSDTVYFAHAWDNRGDNLTRQAYRTLNAATDWAEDQLRAGQAQAEVEQGTFVGAGQWEWDLLCTAVLTGVTVEFTWVEGVAA